MGRDAGLEPRGADPQPSNGRARAPPPGVLRVARPRRRGASEPHGHRALPGLCLPGIVRERCRPLQDLPDDNGGARLDDPRRIGAPQRAAHRGHAQHLRGQGFRRKLRLRRPVLRPEPFSRGPRRLQRLRPAPLADPDLRPRSGLRRAERGRHVLAAPRDAAGPGDVGGPRPGESADDGPLRPRSADEHGDDRPQPDGRRLHPRRRHLRLAVLPSDPGTPDAEQPRRLPRHAHRHQFAETGSLPALPRAGDARVHGDDRHAVVRPLRDVRHPHQLVLPHQPEVDRPEHAAGDEALPKRQIDAAVGRDVRAECRRLPRRGGGPTDAARRPARPGTAPPDDDRTDPLREHERRLRAVQHRRHRSRPGTRRLLRRRGGQPERNDDAVPRRQGLQSSRHERHRRREVGADHPHQPAGAQGGDPTGSADDPRPRQGPACHGCGRPPHATSAAAVCSAIVDGGDARQRHRADSHASRGSAESAPGPGTFQ